MKRLILKENKKCTVGYYDYLTVKSNRWGHAKHGLDLVSTKIGISKFRKLRSCLVEFGTVLALAPSWTSWLKLCQIEPKW